MFRVLTINHNQNDNNYVYLPKFCVLNVFFPFVHFIHYVLCALIYQTFPIVHTFLII